tara:strand:+ start:1062 stop:1331 length:270 start_codon:yes stop_codon:yes gene_type:complete
LYSVEVQKISSTTFIVTVIANKQTAHNVTMSKEFFNKFSAYQVSECDFIKHSFEFLLDREPNTSIMREFNILIIGNYFPDYTKLIPTYF